MYFGVEVIATAFFPLTQKFPPFHGNFPFSAFYNRPAKTFRRRAIIHERFGEVPRKLSRNFPPNELYFSGKRFRGSSSECEWHWWTQTSSGGQSINISRQPVTTVKVHACCFAVCCEAFSSTRTGHMPTVNRGQALHVRETATAGHHKKFRSFLVVSTRLIARGSINRRQKLKLV